MTPAAMSASALHSDAAAMRRKASELVFSIAWNDDAIAKPADCLDDVRRHLLAQPADENLDRVRVAIEVLIVEMLDQLSAGDDPIAVVHEVFEHAILVRSELHRIAVDGHLAGAAVETHRPNLDLVGRMPGGAAHQRTDAGQHLLDMKGLGDIVVGAGVNAPH